MQNPKTSGSIKSSSGSEGGRKIVSPRSVSSDRSSGTGTGRVVRQLKTTGLETNSSTSSRLTKTTSPKIGERVSPRGTAPELQKKRVGRIAELETQVSQLEDALNTVKDQLILSESWKTQAKLDAEESRTEILALTSKLEESQKLLARFSSNEAHDEHDDELKVKLDTTSESEIKQVEAVYEEIHILKEKMAEKNLLIEEIKNQLEDSKSSESQAHAFADETLLQLETAKKTMESLKLNSYEYNATVLELEHTRARVISLEGIIDKMKTRDHKSEPEEIIAMKYGHTLEITAELKKSKSDIEELKANLMDKETELQCIREENEDLHKKLSNLIVGEQENELEHESKHDINGLKSKLTSQEMEINVKTDENEKLKLEIKKLNGFLESSKQDFDILKSKLTNLQTEYNEKLDENEKLKLEFKKINAVMEASKQDFNCLKSMLTEKSDENENLKLEIKKTDGMNEEIKKSMNEQLESVKTSNGEMEEELKRLKTQMSQWRKAAEAATAMLCDENSDSNGRMMADRTWSMDHYSPVKRVNIDSPCNLDIDDDDDDDDDDDEFSKRKNGNVLKRIGVLWKKPQNK